MDGDFHGSLLEPILVRTDLIYLFFKCDVCKTVGCPNVATPKMYVLRVSLLHLAQGKSFSELQLYLQWLKFEKYMSDWCCKVSRN